MINQRIRQTYVKGSKATLNTQLYDPYVRFFRWATDRLGGRDGIVCYISNNSLVDQITFDGMRKNLLQDFTQIYHLDLHGNVRRNPKLSGTTHNVFGIQVGVGITIAVRLSQSSVRSLFYYRVPEYWSKTEKLTFLKEKGDFSRIEWKQLQPDNKHTWLTSGMRSEFAFFLPIGSREAKAIRGSNAESLFKSYSLGASTNRDSYVYSFNPLQLRSCAKTFIDIYNSTVDKLKRQGREIDAISLVNTSDTRIKWTRQVKASLTKLKYSLYNESHIRNCLYRPFTRMYLYFDDFWNEERYHQHTIFPTPAAEKENVCICVAGVGADYQSVFATNAIIDYKCGISGNAGTQSFPYYVYNEEGNNVRENITDWALAQFQAHYGQQVIKRDIFHYVYAMLQHPQYRELYAENLKRELPHIPLLHQKEQFLACTHIGKQLMDIHLNYEQAKEYPLKWSENRETPINWRVNKMRLTPNKDAVVVNEWLTLEGIPQECFSYRLGNRSALEWVIDQYQVSIDKRSGIVSDPNREDDPEHIVRLVGRVVTVSVETVRLVEELAQAVKLEDWMSETVE
jgi:predicted helicase